MDHQPIKSKDHASFDNDYEYIVSSDNVYKCHINSDFDTNGNRTGTWECTVKMGEKHPDVYPFLQPKSNSWQDHVYNAPVSLKGTGMLFKSPTTGTFVGIE